MGNEKKDLSSKLPLERFMDDYIAELGRVRPEELIDDGDGIFIEESAVLDLAHCLFATARRRGICFLN